MFSRFDPQIRRMLTGNLLLIVCCAFYLAWWLIAFKPNGAVKGLRSGWLLIPAFLFGAAAVVKIAAGSGAAAVTEPFMSRGIILAAGVAAYVILLAVSLLLFHRQVTTELFLIVGWTVLFFLEVNALCGVGCFARNTAVLFLILSVLSALVSLICYMLYYGLGRVTGDVDGTIPLLLVAVMMAAVTAAALLS